MCQVYFCSNLHVYLMVAKFLDFRFVLRCVFFGFVLYCYVSLIVLLRFVSRFVLFLFLLLFCSLHCKDCKAPGRIQGAALDLCMLAARFFAEMLIFHWFYKVYITPAGGNKNIRIPMVFVKSTKHPGLFG